MTITELVDTSFGDAVKKGFYACKTCDGEGMLKTGNGDASSCPTCNGSGFYDRNIGEALMLVVSEIGEGQEAHRKGRMCEDLSPLDSLPPEIFETRVKDTFEDELADAVIRIADLCGYLGIDLEKHIAWKLAYNKTRPFKHGKKY